MSNHINAMLLLDVPRSSSTDSSIMSSSSASGSPSTSSSSISINQLTECLHRLHSNEEKTAFITRKKSQNCQHRPTFKKRPKLSLSSTATTSELIHNNGENNNYAHVVHEEVAAAAEDILSLENVLCLEAINEEKCVLLMEALDLVHLLKQDHLSEMPPSVRRRSFNLLSEMKAEMGPTVYSTSDDVEIVHLFGRCFNLSMNAKILKQCQYSDPGMAGRLLADYDVLKQSLQAKLEAVEANQVKLQSNPRLESEFEHLCI
jgi:hypothetical protein